MPFLFFCLNFPAGIFFVCDLCGLFFHFRPSLLFLLFPQLSPGLFPQQFVHLLIVLLAALFQSAVSLLFPFFSATKLIIQLLDHAFLEFPAKVLIILPYCLTDQLLQDPLEPFSLLFPAFTLQSFLLRHRTYPLLRLYRHLFIHRFINDLDGHVWCPDFCRLFPGFYRLFFPFLRQYVQPSVL